MISPKLHREFCLPYDRAQHDALHAVGLPAVYHTCGGMMPLPYRHLTSIIEMLQALEKLIPGVYAGHTLLYGVEVKFYSNRIELSAELETSVSNLFAIGDGAGITRGLLQASASGILAGEAIAKRLVGNSG